MTCAASGIGGGGFLLVRDQDDRNHVFDFREEAPAAAHKDMFVDQLDVRIEQSYILSNNSAAGRVWRPCFGRPRRSPRLLRGARHVRQARMEAPL